MVNILRINDENHSTVLHSFRTIAWQLMNNYKLQSGEAFYRITECEFYYYSENHKDTYVHGHDRQKQTIGEWYFHGSGLDITLGNEKGYGGILLRGIAAVKKESPIPKREDAINGPLKICTELFSQLGSIELQRQHSFGFVNIEREKIGACMPETAVFEVPRIGLNKNIDSKFAEKPYRFLSFLHLPHREQEKVKTFLTSGSSPSLTVDEYNKLYLYKHDS